MKIFRSFEEAKNIKNPVVTTGLFDGVHVGHKTILNRINLLAEKNNGESVLITFHPHPRKVLYPDTSGKDLRLINSQEEKMYLLGKAGLDNVIIVEFTKEFSKITSDEFVRDFLSGKLRTKVVVVGFNHHFGFNKEGDYRQLWNLQKRYDFVAEEIPEQEIQHETVSSTRIRQAIKEGYIQRANAYLDHYYLIIGIPARYSNMAGADNLLFYEIPITEECKLLPPPGIYAISSYSAKFSSKGLAIVDNSADRNTKVLLHVFENEKEFEGKRTTISFHRRVCGPADFFDPDSFPRRLRSAIDEITDLVY